MAACIGKFVINIFHCLDLQWCTVSINGVFGDNTAGIFFDGKGNLLSHVYTPK